MTTTKNLTEQQERDTAREQGLGPLMDALDAAGRDYDVEVVGGTAVVTGHAEDGVTSIQAVPGSHYACRWHTPGEWTGDADPLAQEPQRLDTTTRALAVLP